MREIHPMARQLAQLMTTSDLDELKEVIARWVASAASERQRQQYKELGARILELKASLAEGKVQPTKEELELAFTMMIALAAQADQDTIKNRGPTTK